MRNDKKVETKPRLSPGKTANGKFFFPETYRQLLSSIRQNFDHNVFVHHLTAGVVALQGNRSAC